MEKKKFKITGIEKKSKSIEISQSVGEQFNDSNKSFSDSSKSSYYFEGLFSLQDIIKIVPTMNANIVNGSVQKILELNTKTGRVEKSAFFNFRLAKANYKYFLVTNNQLFNSPWIKYKLQIGIYPEVKLKLRFSIRALQGMEEKMVEALAKGPTPESSLNNLIENWLFNAFNTLNDDPVKNFTNIKNSLQMGIERIASSEGIAIKLFLELEDKTTFLDFVKVDDTIKCKIRDAEIDINTTALLNMENPALFASKEIKNLESWVKRTLLKIISNNIINAYYADLIIYQPKYEQEIRQVFLKETSDIGYSVKQFFTIPDIDKLTLKDRFHLEVGKNKEYNTEIDGVKVRLNIVIDGRISELEGIRKYLSPDININKLMEKESERVVSKYLLRTSPNVYYSSQFEFEIKPELIRLLSEMLIEEFNADENISVIPVWQVTPIIVRLRKLQKGFHHFEFSTFTNELRFKADFSVKAIDDNSWSIFHDNGYGLNTQEEIQAIEDDIIESIGLIVNSNELPLDFKASRDLRLVAFLKEIFREVEENIRRKFGLMIQISGLGRKMGATEKIQIEEDQARINAKMEDTKKQNEGKRRNTLAILSEMDVLNQKIKEAYGRDDLILVNELQEERRKLEMKHFNAKSTKSDQRQLKLGDDKPSNALERFGEMRRTKKKSTITKR